MKDRPEAQIGACDSCSYENVEVKAYMRSYGDPFYNKNNEYTEDEEGNRSFHWYCMFCSHTFLSSFTSYPRLYTDSSTRNIAVSIGWIANYFDEKLKEMKNEKSMDVTPDNRS